MKNKIALGSDHAGFELKEKIKAHLKQNYQDWEISDLGTDSEDVSVDYPDLGFAVAKEIESNSVEFGILVCGSGIGISIAANRFKSVRCALVWNEEHASLAREHNNANVIALGGRLIDHQKALLVVDKFLSTKYEDDERHSRRIDKLSNC